MRSKNNQSNTHYPLFDVLRGMAIAWIVYYHGSLTFLDYYPYWLKKIIASGYLGIDMFLIISGFCISASARQIILTNGNVKIFLKKRMSRVYFPYWLSILTICLLLPLIVQLLVKMQGLNMQYKLPYFSLVEWLKLLTLTKIFWAENWMLSRVYIELNSPIWYLSIILQIYLVVTVALFLKKYYDVVIWVVTALSLFCLSGKFMAMVPFGLFLPFWPSFALGIILYHLLSKNIHPTIWASNTILRRTTYLIIFCLPLSGIYISRIAFNLLLFLAIWLMNAPLSRHMDKKFFTFFIFLGTFSYSTFLLHIPVHSALHIILNKIIKISPWMMTTFVIIPSVIMLSYFWYLLFEKPKSPFRLLYSLKKK